MEEPVTLTVGSVALDARLARPSSSAGGIVLCHPHPLYGGDMDNPVVARAAEVCRSAGLATLRFNFRGVGKSSGLHDKGEGEREDVSAALDFLRQILGGSAPLGVIGYSFGAWVGGQVACSDAGVNGLVMIAPPLAFYDFGFLTGCRKTLLLVAGSQDLYCPREAFEALAAGVRDARSAVIDGADHFFFGKLYPLGETVAGWARRLSEARPGNAGGAGRPG